MNVASPSPIPGSEATDPRQKRRLIIGVAVWIVGWLLALAMVPLVNASNLSDGLKATLSGILLLGCPKLFLVIAVAIMGKPGFTYLKSLIGSHFRRLAPAATVSPLRYRIGLVLFITVIVLGAIGPYLGDLVQMRELHPRVFAAIGDLLFLLSLFLLGGDFWDKLRSLFVREAKAVFPQK